MISLDELRRKQPGTVIGITVSELLALVALAERTGCDADCRPRVCAEADETSLGVPGWGLRSY